MGFIQAFAGAIGGAFAEQWTDFYMAPTGISATAGVFPAVKKETDKGRGSNVVASENIITNGSRILVPENTALITLENGAITGFVAQPGGFIYTTDTTASQSIFTGGGLVQGLIMNSWERFKFGGIPGVQQLAFYVNLKEIPNNKFGTQSAIYWNDAYFGAQVGALTRGTYTLKITDPIVFIKSFVPVKYLIQGAVPFDFSDVNNPASEQLFNEVVQSLSAAFSSYTNDPSKGNRIMNIQADSVGFAHSLSGAVEAGYRWATERGLTIITAALQAIEYDEPSKALLADIQKADALMGARGNSFLQQSVARGIEAAGEGDGGALGIGMMGMGLGAAGGMMGGLQQPVAGAPQAAVAAAVPAPAPAAAEDPYEKLTKLKGLLDAGVISQEDFDNAKKGLLGI